LCSVDKYLESQAAAHANEVRSVRSGSVEERHCVTPISSHATMHDDNVSLQRNTQQTVRSRSLEERHDGDSRARCETDASRSLSYPCDDTAVKTCVDVCIRRDTQQNDAQERGRVGGVTQQHGTHMSVNSARLTVGINNRPGLNSLSDVVCEPSVETDGPEPDAVSPQLSTRGSVLSPTCASLANDSGYVEQDGAVLPPLVSVTSTVSTHRRPAGNHSGPVTLKNYQKELAEPGCKGSNCIICAPTGSGKTFTAGEICRTRRSLAIAQRCRFKCLFVVCIRNLIAQQRDALCQIMPECGVVCGMDDKLLLSEYFQHYDVVVATAQVCLYVESSVVINCKYFVCFTFSFQITLLRL